ncbi:phosphopantetheine-binding protein [Kibdelosporangium phytohabitans]|uniref:Acyl carrier protein n=1 Tax=Kibdelosporangium phytohabitans TaxID=860235 RepID=A0A0N9I4G7_9PSEU|nr:phosphopantetheine-binding protein [Kibdelosporangium phytohabitans]ALG09248.1 acyl carrier protein [Kibdelosporangium phytohabitans]MBE1469512.1 acyl carrier protein [Kibdelosporangium phytohabitans]
MTHIESIKQFVLEQFLPDVAASDLADDYDLVDGGVVDSLGLLKLLAWLEDEFGLPVDDLELAPDTFRTIEAIDAFIASNAPVLNAPGVAG